MQGPMYRLISNSYLYHLIPINMNKLHSIMAMLVTILFSMPSFAQEQKLNPERVRNQEAVYNASEKTVTITAEAPTQTEYDWDTYVQYDLTHISDSKKIADSIK